MFRNLVLSLMLMFMLTIGMVACEESEQQAGGEDDSVPKVEQADVVVKKEVSPEASLRLEESSKAMEMLESELAGLPALLEKLRQSPEPQTTIEGETLEHWLKIFRETDRDQERKWAAEQMSLYTEDTSWLIAQLYDDVNKWLMPDEEGWLKVQASSQIRDAMKLMHELSEDGQQLAHLMLLEGLLVKKRPGEHLAYLASVQHQRMSNDDVALFKKLWLVKRDDRSDYESALASRRKVLESRVPVNYNKAQREAYLQEGLIGVREFGARKFVLDSFRNAFSNQNEGRDSALATMIEIWKDPFLEKHLFVNLNQDLSMLLRDDHGYIKLVESMRKSGQFSDLKAFNLIRNSGSGTEGLKSMMTYAPMLIVDHADVELLVWLWSEGGPRGHGEAVHRDLFRQVVKLAGDQYLKGQWIDAANDPEGLIKIKYRFLSTTKRMEVWQKLLASKDGLEAKPGFQQDIQRRLEQALREHLTFKRVDHNDLIPVLRDLLKENHPSVGIAFKILVDLRSLKAWEAIVSLLEEHVKNQTNPAFAAGLAEGIGRGVRFEGLEKEPFRDRIKALISQTDDSQIKLQLKQTYLAMAEQPPSITTELGKISMKIYVFQEEWLKEQAELNTFPRDFGAGRSKFKPGAQGFFNQMDLDYELLVIDSAGRLMASYQFEQGKRQNHYHNDSLKYYLQVASGTVEKAGLKIGDEVLNEDARRFMDEWAR